ncbi:hypothetical protein [Aphanizomenon flos-aquae]|uniref:hypothetical protein n=1 Tax=Aphanizomenon flos-aquae TaxID=1176 RepID=UPI0004895E73|nr:hypothetical protein [Aphanizomenon flos-aquae]
MNSIYTAKILANKNQYAGREWCYDFRELNKRFNEETSKKVRLSLAESYSKLTKEWNAERNSEWLCRIYLSAKMIMTATLQLNALDYAGKKNFRLVAPYLAYYSIFSLARSIVYTIPEQDWKQGELVKISHNKALNIAFNHVSKFDEELSSKLKKYTLKVKAYRELISYRAPSSGDSNVGSVDDINSMATLLAEVAQFNSEILEASIIKNANDESFIFVEKYIHDLSNVKIESECFFDKEDCYRLKYFKRKYPVAPNILHIMREGHIEDFFGSWVDHEESDDSFNTNNNWQLIFDLP